MSLDCPICYQTYDLGDYEPMSLECGHTFCKICCATFSKCPFDRRPVIKIKLVRNFGLIGLIEDRQQKLAKMGLHLVSGEIECPAHKIERSLFCMKENVAICSECVLFGDHIGHEVKKIESLKSDSDRLDVQSGNKNLQFEIDKYFNYDRELEQKTQTIQKIKQKIISEINNEFNDHIECIMEEKQNTLEQLDPIFEMATKSLNQTLLAKKKLVNQCKEQISAKKNENITNENSKSIENLSSIISKLSISKDLEFIVKELKLGLNQIDKSSYYENIANAAKFNIERVFYKKGLSNQTPSTIVLNRIKFIDFHSNSYDKLKPTKILVRNAPLTLEEEAMREIAEICGPIKNLQIMKNGSSFNGCFKLKFENENSAKQFLFLDELLIEKKKLKIEYDTSDIVEKTTKSNLINNQSSKTYVVLSRKKEKVENRNEGDIFGHIYAD
jgi:hypothetical protein